VARTTTDIDRVQYAVRFGVPRVLVTSATIVLTAAAAVLTSPLVALGLLAGVPLLLGASRWYLKRATAGYLRESAAYATIFGTITETVEGARTVDALGLGARRRRRLDEDVREAFEAEKYTLRLRSVLFPLIDTAFLMPVLAVLVWGAYLVATGGVTIGAVTTVAIYASQIIHPIGELIFWMDEIQVGSRSEERRVGEESRSRGRPCNSSRRRHTRFSRDWSSDVCSSDLLPAHRHGLPHARARRARLGRVPRRDRRGHDRGRDDRRDLRLADHPPDRRAHLLDGRDPGRLGLARTHHRRRRRRARPGHEGRAARARAGRGPHGPLRLPRGPRRAARDRPRAAARGTARRRRTVRCGQVDARPHARGHPPAHGWLGHRGRGPARGPAPRRAARPGRTRDAGASRVRRDARGEPAPREPRGERG